MTIHKDETAEFEKDTAPILSRPLTARELEYDENLKNCIFKDSPHEAKIDPSQKERSPKIYTITTIARSPTFGGNRTPGVFTSFAKAQKIVEENQGDIWECSYMFVVIEAVELDRLYGWCHELYWYAWVGDHTGCYKPIETPEMYKQTCGFGIG